MTTEAEQAWAERMAGARRRAREEGEWVDFVEHFKWHGLVLLAVFFSWLFGGCYACPTGPTPLIYGAEWEWQSDDAPSQMLLGTLSIPAGTSDAWLCDCWCDESWATIWVGDADDPDTPIPTPRPLPVVDPVTGRDYLAMVTATMDSSAWGRATCTLHFGGDEDFVFELQAPL